MGRDEPQKEEPYEYPQAGIKPKISIERPPRRKGKKFDESAYEVKPSRRQFDYDLEEPPAQDVYESEEQPRRLRKKRLDSLKKEALRGLQEIQAVISTTYHFGGQIGER